MEKDSDHHQNNHKKSHPLKIFSHSKEHHAKEHLPKEHRPRESHHNLVTTEHETDPEKLFNLGLQLTQNPSLK